MAQASPHQSGPSVTLVDLPPPLNVKRGRKEWKSFKQKWNSHCIVSRPDDEGEKRALFLHTLGQEGLKVYNRMQLPADHSVDSIITAFDKHFFGKNNETHERYKFNKRKQKPGETVTDYVAALRTLASTCNFCDCLKDTLLRDRIVLGIRDGSMRKRLLKEGDLNLETCIAVCCAAEAASPSQPVKTETWTEDTTALEAGSVSSGDQRSGREQVFSMSLRHRNQMASLDEAEMSEVNFNEEMDDSDDSWTPWTTERQSSGVPRNKLAPNKLEPAWAIVEDSPDQPSAVYGTAQPMSDNTSLLSLDSPDQPSAVYGTTQPMSDNTSGSLQSCVCQRCSVAFVLVSSLELHLASVHGEKLHVVLPGLSTPDKYGVGAYNTSNVDKKVENRRNKKIARKRKADDDDDDAGDKHGKKKGKPNMCDSCGKFYATASGLRKHRAIHTHPKRFVCGVCGEGFLRHSHLLNHCAKTDHKSFACDFCDKAFTHSRSLSTHRRVHTGERPYKCPHCDSGFKQWTSLHFHVAKAHGEGKVVCDICGESYPSLQLKRHRQTHKGEKPYQCLYCEKRFTESSHRTRHHKLHSGEKPHMCSDCGKSFSQAYGLKIHRLTHTGYREHVCHLCPSAFKLRSHLKMHIKLKHSGQQNPGQVR